MKRIIFALWGLVAIAAIGAVWVYFQGNKSAPCPGGVVVPGGHEIGGAFEATNHLGERVTDETLLNGLSLVYFGYTFCPDICPIDTVRNAEVTDLLAEKGITLTPIFVTVDPARDTPETMGKYVSFVHERMIGVTGSDDEIDRLKTLYKAYGQMQPPEDPEYPEFYTVDHSSFSYLMNGTEFTAAYSRNQTAGEIADNIQCQAQNLGLEH